jgi:hypothetical protein
MLTTLPSDCALSLNATASPDENRISGVSHRYSSVIVPIHAKAEEEANESNNKLKIIFFI